MSRLLSPFCRRSGIRRAFDAFSCCAEDRARCADQRRSLHGSLDRYVKLHPTSALAGFAAHGVTYTSAYATMPSDSFPGLLALITGGTPRTTGVWYDAAFARDLADPKECRQGTAATGMEYDYSEAINVAENARDTMIDPKKLAADPAQACAPVFPHQLLRVNTVFEVAKQAGLRTAWSDKHPAYDLVQGPFGKGVDDLFVPEINVADTTDSVEKTIAYDTTKVDAVVHELKGFDHTGSAKVGVPAVLGMNFQAVSVAQKLKGNGYLDAAGEPSPGLAAALDATDRSLARLASTLETEGLAPSTLVIVSAKHGQTPIDPARRRIVDGKSIKRTIEAVAPGSIASITTDDVALIWLTDKAKTETVAKALQEKASELAVDTILWGTELAKTLAVPATDSRAPDVGDPTRVGRHLHQADGDQIAEHGGGAGDDRHVALLGVEPGPHRKERYRPGGDHPGRPHASAALGLNPQMLQAVVAEKTEPLQEVIDALASRS